MRFVFRGDKMTCLYDTESTDFPGTFKLDPTQEPKTIDIVMPPAPGAQAGRMMRGIYEFAGDKLRMCWGQDGVARPKEFKAPPARSWA